MRCSFQRREYRLFKMSSRKQQVYGAVMSYAVIFTQLLTGLFYTPIILKTLGQSEYGVYALVLSCMGYLTIFDTGMHAAFVRFYVQEKEKNADGLPGLNGLFLKIFFLLAIASIVFGVLLSVFSQNVFGGNIKPEEYLVLNKCLKLLALDAGLTVLNCVFTSLIIANEQFVFGKLVNLFSAVLTPALTLPMLLRGNGAVMVLFIKLIVDGMAFFMNGVFCLRILRITFDLRKQDTLLWKSIVLFAGAIVVQSMVDQFNWQVDKLVLGRVCGTGDISIYSVGSSLNQYYITMACAVSGVFIVKVNQLEAQENMRELNHLFQKTSRLFALLFFWIMSAYIVFGKNFILRWAGTEYGASYDVGLLIMLPVTISLTQGLGQDIARAKNKHRLQIILNILVSFLNVLFSIPLASIYGAVGSAFGTFLAELAICIVIQFVYYQKIIGLDMRAYFIEMLRIAKGLVIPALFGRILVKSGWMHADYGSIFLWGIFYTGVYGCSMWLLSVNVDEKEWIRAVVSTVFRKNRSGR